MQNLPPEIIDKIYSHTDIAVCIRDKQYYALSQFPEVDMKWAARYGHLELVKYFHSIGKVYSPMAIELANMNGHSEVVKYLYEVVDIECTDSAMEWATYNGYLKIVKYLHSKGAKCTTEAMELATSYGYHEVAKFLKNKCKKTFL